MMSPAADGGGGGLLLRGGVAGLTYILADSVDRFIAGYDPSATGAKPQDKFTSDGSGALANTLNIASAPTWDRWASAAAFAAVPTVGAIVVEDSAMLQGAALGGGVHLAKLLWSNVLMPMLIGKDTSTAGLKGSVIARLYPSEVAAKISADQHAVSSGGGAGALSGDSPYPDASTALALRRQAGVVSDSSPYMSTEQALRQQAGVSDSSPYPDAGQALALRNAGYATTGQFGTGEQVDITPMTHAITTALPGVHPDAAAQAVKAAVETPHDVHGALMLVFPRVPANVLLECARRMLPNVQAVHAAAAAPANSQPPPLPKPLGVSQPPAYTPGPPAGQGPGPKFDHDHEHDDSCGCVGSVDLYGGFLGAAEEDSHVSPMWNFDAVSSRVSRAGGKRSDDRRV